MKVRTTRIRPGSICDVIALLLLAFLPGMRPAAAQEVSEVQAKAAFVYNFARFTEWPQDAFAGHDSPIIIGVVEDASFARTLEQTVRGKQINGRSIRVKQIASDADLKSRMHVAYLSSSCSRHTLAALAGASVLTVGDSEHFIRTGGMIRLYVQDAHVRFAINPDSAEHARLKLSSRLLALATIVRGAGTER